MEQAPQRMSFAQAGFDPRYPHPRNQKTGLVAGFNPFRVKVQQSSEGRGSVTHYEYPVGSGIYYVRSDAPDGSPMLQLDKQASAEGLRKREEAEKMAKRTAVEKADANLKQAQAEFDRAKKDADAEAAALKAAGAAAPKVEKGK